MKVLSSFTNINSHLPLNVSIWEISNGDNFPVSDKITAEEHFKILKLRNFIIADSENDKSWQSNTYYPEANYSNYLISRIEFSDFRKVAITDYEWIIRKSIESWSKVYNNIIESDLNWFLDTTIKQIQFIANKYQECYIFDLDPKGINSKRHQQFTLFEYFTSVFFYGCKLSESQIGYVLLSYG